VRLEQIPLKEIKNPETRVWASNMLVKAFSGVGTVNDSYAKSRSTSSPNVSYLTIKRWIDVVAVLATAPAVLIVILIAAAAIRLAEGGPAFFIQERVGRGGRIFRMLKLRTMKTHSSGSQIATIKNDPRITPLGQFLRQSHIDELPQLWNIFVGDMTLIGPRPEQPLLVAQYREKLPGYDLRHAVRPGLSGWAQVNFGYAADLEETARKLDYDLEYVSRCGPTLDLLIVLRTFRIFLDPRYVR
jgi:lipopolysaccharide/colanic/teichoic acid biosynthesis glycosyltransferase